VSDDGQFVEGWYPTQSTANAMTLTRYTGLSITSDLPTIRTALPGVILSTERDLSISYSDGSSPFTYLWTQNGTTLSTSTNSYSLTNTDLAVSKQNSTVKCRVTDQYGYYIESADCTIHCVPSWASPSYTLSAAFQVGVASTVTACVTTEYQPFVNTYDFYVVYSSGETLPSWSADYLVQSGASTTYVITPELAQQGYHVNVWIYATMQGTSSTLTQQLPDSTVLAA
jgi:hypothetical protein